MKNYFDGKSIGKTSLFLKNKTNKDKEINSFLKCKICGHEGKWSIYCEKCKSNKFAS